MYIVKNTFGISAVLGHKQSYNIEENSFAGSSLDRKKLTEEQKEVRKEKNKNKREESQEQSSASVSSTWIDEETGEEITLDKVPKLRFMSQRTKSKIRKKLMAFSQVYKKLSFVTLTFVNAIEDKKAVLILRRFLDNFKKRSKSFDYMWVAERQTLNQVFKDNIHFHLVTNKFWDIQKTLNYWLEVQAKHGVMPRDKNFKPSSAFDVKRVSTKNPRQVALYLTKYVTKNKSEFDCQVWNCSQGVSELYTDFYTNTDFLDELYRLKGDEIKEHPMEFCNLHFIPLDKSTFRFYDRLQIKNNELIDCKNAIS